MANQPKTPQRAVRVEDELWRLAGEVAKAHGSDRTKEIVGFLRWYVGEEGAVLPTGAQRVGERRE